MSLHHNRHRSDLHTVPDPRLFLAHPGGGHSFGYLNEIRYQAERLEAGHIRLRFGEHFGPNRGYGVHHIIAEHWKSLQDHPDGIVMAAVRFVSNIVQPGAAIHCEFASIRGHHRPIVLSRPTGYVVLEPKHDTDSQQFYSVVTAVPSTKAKGPRVGTL